MASKDKPYRVYRGGRAKGPIRQEPPRDRARRRGDGDDPRARGAKRSRRHGRRWPRILLVLVLVAVLLVLVWAVLGYLALRSGVAEANDRLDSRTTRVLAPQEGSILSNPSTILVLGTDEGPDREGPFRTDAMMIVRTDPDEHRIALLAIPRDLRVDIPNHGVDKVNAAYAFGGSTLAVTTVQNLVGEGLPINHVVVMNFADFRGVIDALGGVSVTVRERILSNKFECPRSTKAQCDRWKGYRFAPGEQEMNGRRALIYARIRQNQLDASDNDFTRGERQQQVLQATADEITSLGTFLRLPFIGDDLVEPIATDLSANQLLQLAWVKSRTPESETIRCRLGGTIANLNGQSVVLGSEENRSVIAMVAGETAAQPPPPGSGPFGPGCRIGRG
ncbi:MAG TPA: LCP family protein [Gaiellaceae bacterium]|nr:LCP family protein [Gaiellaceae bacterium]